jgi:thiol-disulfide isomerase/thioredoxin
MTENFKNSLYILALVVFIAISCKGNPKQQQPQPSKQFSMPTIPVMLIDPQARANYLAGHYWDNFDFNDTAFVNKPDITEQAFVDYIDVLPYTEFAVMVSSVRHTLEQAQANEDMFTYFTDLFEKYLYDPNSPMRNEEIYIAALEYIIDSPQIDEPNKIRPRFQFEQLNKNRPGQIAVDFVYTLANGKRERLHQIKSDYLIIFFNNPGCSACQSIQHGLENSPVILRMQETGQLKIFAMYVDRDIDAWTQYRPSIPMHWINGYDASFVIHDENLYDLRAIPNLYLLDKDKRVILKDAPPEYLEQLLINIMQAG